MSHNTFIFHIPRSLRILDYARAWVNPPVVNHDRIRDILSLYDLKLNSSPRNLLGGLRNRNVVVDTSAGKKVLKRYQDAWPVSTIIHEHSILSRLKEIDFPAPRLVPALDGATYVFYQNEIYALFDFIKGTNYTNSMMPRLHRLRLASIAGETHARIHRALDGFLPMESHHNRGCRSYSGDRCQDMTWYEGKLEELKDRSQNLTSEEDRAQTMLLIGKSGYILEEISLLYEKLRAASLPSLVTHGDYGTHNLLVQKNGIATPIDFESASIDWRMFDLALSLARFRYSKTEVSYDFEFMHHYVAAYSSVFSLSSAERELMPSIWRFCKLDAAVRFWISYFETNGPVRKLVSARDAINQSDWVMQNPDKLMAILP